MKYGNVEVIYADIERMPYADTKQKYVVRADEGTPEWEVERICSESVHRCRARFGKEYYFGESYYTFSKIGKNEYVYTVIEPFLD